MLETPLESFVMGLGLSKSSRRLRATDACNSDPALNDLDGTPNDTGFTAGPFAVVP